MAAKILRPSRNANSLQTRMEKEGLDDDDVAQECPWYDETELRELTLEVYQLRMARSYTKKDIDVDGKFEIILSDDILGILSTKIQSRHFWAKQYKSWNN